jgi:hypothetical protein
MTFVLDKLAIGSYEEAMKPVAFQRKVSIIANTPEDLGRAIKNNHDEIEITGDIKVKTIRIKKTGKVCWLLAAGAISTAVLLAQVSGTTDVANSQVSLPAGPAFSLAPVVAASILGVGTAFAAVSIAVAGGGLGALVNLRKGYNLVEHPGKTVLIKEKNR